MLIAQKWFQTRFKALSGDVQVAEALAGEEP
jgi:hypothetical protein